MKGPSQLLIQTSQLSQGIDDLQSHEIRVPEILFPESHGLQAISQFLNGCIEIILGLMLRRQGTEQIEIDPVGTLVGLGVLVDGNLGAGNDPRHCLREIPHLIVPFIRSRIDHQKGAT